MPALRLENAASVGAKMVNPLFELLSWPYNWSETPVLFKRRIKTENPPALPRILVTSGTPFFVGGTLADWTGAGALAG